MNQLFLFRKNMTPIRKLLLMKMFACGVPISEYTATGNPLTFNTNVAKPLKSLVLPWTPIQSGTGDPSPDNIRPISGVSALNVWQTGKNVLYLSDQTQHNNWNIGNIPNPLKPGTKYTYSVNGTATAKYRLYYGNSASPLTAVSAISSGYIGAGEHETFTTPSEMGDILVFAGNASGAGNESLENILPMLELGESATPYTSYTGTTKSIVFPDEVGTVYGGSLDVVSGVLTVNRGYSLDTGSDESDWGISSQSETIARFTKAKNKFPVAPKNSSTSNLLANYFKSSSTLAEWDAFIGSTGNLLCYVPKSVAETKEQWCAYLAENPLEVVYELEEPYTIQLTPTQVNALLGDNVIWSDTNGTNTAIYFKKG